MRSIGNKREPRVQSCLFLCLIVGAAVQEPRKNGMGVVALSRDGGVRAGRHNPKTASDETCETGVFSVCPAERCAVLTAQQENYDVNSLLDTPASAPAYRLKVNVKVPGFKIQSRYSRLDEMGLEVGIRSSDTSVWYFDVVPTPHNNRFFTVCVTLPEDTDRRDGSSWDTAHKCDQKTVAGTAFTSLDAQDGPSVGVVHGIEIELPRLEQGVHEVTISLLDGNRHRLAVSSSVHVWVMPPGSDSASAESAITSAAAASKRRGASMRKEAEKLKEERKQIAANYKPLHEELRSLKIEQMIDPELLAALSSGDPRQLHDLMIPVEPSVSSSSPASQVKPAQPVSLSDGIHNTVFKFKLFSEEFCRLMVEEAKHAVEWQMRTNASFTRPNTMNNYGFVLDELGIDLMPVVVRKVLAPLSTLYFPDWGGNTIDSVHAFTISYTMSGDRDLDRHMDQSEVTVNANIGGVFEGGEVYFNGQRDSILQDKETTVVVHSPGVALMHAGQHFHGAKPLSSGERHNLVMWMRSSSFESSPAQRFTSECAASGTGSSGIEEYPNAHLAATDTASVFRRREELK